MAQHLDNHEELRNVDDRISFYVVYVVYVELVSLPCIASVLPMMVPQRVTGLYCAWKPTAGLFSANKLMKYVTPEHRPPLLKFAENTQRNFFSLLMHDRKV